MAVYIAKSVWGYCFICYKGTPRPDNEIRQDTILTPFLCLITKPFQWRMRNTVSYTMKQPTEMDYVIYCMSAEANEANYNQPSTKASIEEETRNWLRDFGNYTKEQLIEYTVAAVRNNMKYMNWAEDDIEGVAWFMGIYTRVALKAGYTNSFADFIMPAMRKYNE